MTERIVRQQASTARVVNLAGRQRMLCQRITRVAEEMAAGTTAPAAGRAIILEAATNLDTAQTALLQGDASIGIPAPTSTTVAEIYTEPPFELDRQLHDFLREVRSVAANPQLNLGDPQLRAMVTTLETSVVPGLDRAVLQYQQDSEARIAHLDHLISTLTWVMLVVLALEALLIYRPLFNRLTHAIQQLLQASTTDLLTRVLNRNAFLQHAEAELNRARHAGTPTSLILADLDTLKQVNDRHGHAAGDLALRHFTAIAQSNLRSNDRIGRLGGEEFAILLCGTPLEGAVLAAERIRERLAGSTAALMPDNYRVFITASFGVTVAAPNEAIPDLIARAELSLLRAKTRGRNCVESAMPAAADAPLIEVTTPLPQRSVA